MIPHPSSTPYAGGRKRLQDRGERSGYAVVPRYIVPPDRIEVYWNLVIIYPPPYSIYLRGTTRYVARCKVSSCTLGSLMVPPYS